MKGQYFITGITPGNRDSLNGVLKFASVKLKQIFLLNAGNVANFCLRVHNGKVVGQSKSWKFFQGNSKFKGAFISADDYIANVTKSGAPPPTPIQSIGSFKKPRRSIIDDVLGTPTVDPDTGGLVCTCEIHSLMALGCKCGVMAEQRRLDAAAEVYR